MELALVKALVRREAPKLFGSLEGLLTSPYGFALPASPVQRAICRVADGRPLGDLADNAEVRATIGDTSQVTQRPRWMILLSGIRAGKSLITAAVALWASQTCDLSGLSAGEIPRVSVVSLRKDLADVVLQHLLGAVQGPMLRELVIGDPVAGSIMLRHPSGTPVEIRVVAGARAGATLVSRWSAGAIFDEAPRMIGADDGVVNLDDAHAAIRGRMLPGSQIWDIGSPWAPYGPVYDAVTEHEGNLTNSVCVIRAPAPVLNPVWWTPERCDELKRDDPTAYRTDVLAQFADPDTALIPSDTIAACCRDNADDLPYDELADYAATMDPATRGNAWTLNISTRRGVKKRVAMVREWVGSSSEPLRPRDVLAEISVLLKQYGLDWVRTDQWSADAIRDIGEDYKIDVISDAWTSANRTRAFLALAQEMAQGDVELPNHPTLRRDLAVVRRRVTATGIAIELPKTQDGRHADHAAALAHNLSYWLDDVAEGPPEDEDERASWESDKRQERAAGQLEQGGQGWLA